MPEQPDGPVSSRRRWIALFAIVAAAAVLIRLIFFAELLHVLPFYRFTAEGFDQHAYNVWAQSIVEGDVLARGRGLFFRAPLCPYLLALVYLVAGSGNVTAGIVMNGLLGVGAAVCAAGIGRRFFGWWGGLAAGLLMALNGAQLSVEAMLLGDVPVAAFLLAGLWLVVELLEGEGPEERLAAWLWLLPGILFGLACLGRSSNLLPVAALCALVGLPFFRGRWRRLGAAALLLAGCSLPLAPAVLRNGLMHGSWTVNANGPLVLYLGNTPGAPGTFTYPPGFKHDHSFRDGPHWLKRLGRELREQPLSLVGALARKTLLFFNAWHVPNNGNYDFARQRVRSLKFCTFGPLLFYVLGFLGVVLTARDWRRLLPLYVFGGAFAASIIVALVAGRYKLPFLGVLAVFGGGAVVVLRRSLLRRRWRTLALSVALAALLTGVFWPRAPGGTGYAYLRIRPTDYLANAAALARCGRLEEAAEMLQQGVRRFPRQAVFPERLSGIYLEMGRPRDALAATERAVANGVISRRLLERRVIALSHLGHPGEVRRAARDLLRVDPDNPLARRVLRREGAD